MTKNKRSWTFYIELCKESDGWGYIWPSWKIISVVTPDFYLCIMKVYNIKNEFDEFQW